MAQESHSGQPSEVSRRHALTRFLAAGTSAAAAATISADETTPADSGITPEMLRNSEWMANLEVSEEDADRTARGVTRLERQLKKLREFQTGYETLPAMRFDPELAAPESRKTSLNRPEWLTPQPADQIMPNVDGEPQVAFASLRQLGRQLRSGGLSSVQLTSACLELLKSRGPALKCVVSLTKELALQQAERADKELQAGHDRGPLHGIPWGAKDLISVPDYPTTWGAPQFRDRVLSNPATVYSRLTDAGAVLVAKLSLGALAMGDKWFEGMTRNPWNPEQGSSGSSAGSAAAVAAGLVPFAIGSETLGSIISPSRRCGVTSLRPTFGRVSRAGCMTLSWTMDKIGPMARRIDDIATVFSAMHGADAADPTTVDRWFAWPVSVSLKSLRVGHVQNSRTSPQEQIALDILKEQGATLVPIELPQDFPVWEMAAMLDVEAATVFHELTAQGETEGLNSWPGIFRKAHFVSATDFLHAQRVRFELMKKMVAVFDSVDLYVGGNDLGITNLTGHPSVVLPTKMSEDEEHPQPVCCTLTGRLYDDATLLAAALIIERAVALTDKVPPQRDTPTAEDSK